MSMGIDKIMNGGRQYSAKKTDSKSPSNKTGKTEAKQGAMPQMMAVKNQNSVIKQQPELSEKAQGLLEKLKKTYGSQMDFMIYGENDDPKDMLKYATKEYTVLFSAEELEKMASDEKYEKESMDKVLKAITELDGIAEKTGMGTEKDGNKGDSQITRIGISFNADGTLKLFADLEKSTAQQQERMEKLRQKRTEEKKAAEKKEAKKADETDKDKDVKYKTNEEKSVEKSINDYYSKFKTVKRTTVEADSVDELIEKINGVNWDDITEDMKPTGKLLNMKA